MKNLLLYLMLSFLGLAMIIAVDLLSGLSISSSFQSIYSAFATTTTKEYIIIFIFISLPVIPDITAFFKNRLTTHK